MIIGVLKEVLPEKRVAITPDIVAALKQKGVTFQVENGAGEQALFSDELYKAAGAELADRNTVVQKSDVIACVSSLTVEVLKDIPNNKVLVGAFNPFGNKELLQAFTAGKYTTFSLELIPRTTRAQAMDILSSMATVAGYRAVLSAANMLPRFFPMFMSAAGTIKPAKILILGAGVAGLQAIAIARKLGAVVEVFDVRSAVKEEVLSLGGKFVEVEGATEDKNAGGYAVEQTEEFKQKQAALIQEKALQADAIICTAQIPGRKAPVLVQAETVKNMKPGAVIVDLAASTGGNCELTENAKTINVGSVTIIGESDYPSTMAGDASSMYGKNLTNFTALFLDSEGKLNVNFEDDIVDGTCLTKDGEVKNERAKQVHGL